MTTAETAWTEAMRYENRHDPYRFFDELRKTPVVQVADKVYVVTGYRELLQLAHDPHVSSDISQSPISAQPPATMQPDVGAEHMQAYGREPSLIVSDPAKHDRQRRQVMRHFAPPHSPNVIPNMAADIQTLCDDSLDRIKANGRQTSSTSSTTTPIRCRSRSSARSSASRSKDEPTFHGWIFDFMAGADMGPDAATEEGQAAQAEGQESTAALTAVHGRPDPGVPDGTAGQRAVQVGERQGRPGRADDAAGGCGQRDAAADRRARLDGQHHRALRADAAAQSRVDRPAAREARTDPQGDRGGAAAAVGRPVLPQPQRDRRRRGRRDRHPRGLGGAPAVRRRQPRSRSGSPTPRSSTSSAPDNQHVGWGRGVHSCVGGPLARLEVNIALETFLRRVENPRLVVDPPPYRENQVFRGPLHLEVEFDRIAD